MRRKRSLNFTWLFHALFALAIAFVAALILAPGTMRQSQVAAAPLAATAGPNFAGTAASGTWTSPNFATGANDGINCATIPWPGPNPNQIDLTNFLFSIPAGSVITGIRVEPKAALDGLSSFSAQLLKTNSPVGAAKNWTPPNVATGCNLTTFTSLGSAGDLWGTTWTPSDLNAANFGVRITGTCGNNGETCMLDAARITVSYDPPAPVLPAAPQEVPEGDTLLLLGGGMGGLATWVGCQFRKRRRDAR
jgi:hypothetical protein